MQKPNWTGTADNITGTGEHVEPVVGLNPTYIYSNLYFTRKVYQMNATLRNNIIAMTQKFASINNYDPRLIFDLEYREEYRNFVTNTYDEENTPFNMVSRIKSLCNDLLNIVKPSKVEDGNLFSIDMSTDVEYPVLSLVEVLAPHWGHNYPLHTPVLITILRETTDPIFNANGVWADGNGDVISGNKITNKKGIILPATLEQINGFVEGIGDNIAEKIISNNSSINMSNSNIQKLLLIVYLIIRL